MSTVLSVNPQIEIPLAEFEFTFARSGGPGEFIRNGETGLTVIAEPDAIGEGLTTTLADAPYARRLGEAGRVEAESRFSWDVIAGETEAIYAQV